MDRIKPKALIFGRSFGLYGHAMALDELGFDICLPSHYRATIFSRKEYTNLQKNVSYLDDPFSDMSMFSIICCARRPSDNYKLVTELIQRGYSGSVVVEKPMGISPDVADKLALALTQAELKWDIPYLFLQLGWFDLVKQSVLLKTKISILWCHNGQFAADHWKANITQGGGVIGFYLIHIIAIFVKLGLPFQLNHSKDGSCRMTSTWLDVEFKLSDQALFTVIKNDKIMFSNQSPFGSQPKKGLKDTRIPALQRFYQDFLARKDYDEAVAFHKRVHQRWYDVVI